MKASRKKVAARRRPARRVAPLTLTQRVERLEKATIFHAIAPAVAAALPRFRKLDADGKPTKKEIEDGTGVEKLVFGPKSVIARDGQAAAITAVTGTDAPQGLDINRAEVIVRPFA